MRILLIDPYLPNSKGLNTGLGWLSASIKANGHDVYVLDLNNRNVTNYENAINSCITGYKPDMVGINIHCVTHAISMQMVNNISNYYNGYIIVGGPQLAYERGKILEDNENISFAVIGEGEETVKCLIKSLEAGNGFGAIEGLAYRDNGTVRVNELRHPITDLNKLPFPDYRLFGVKEIKVPYRISTSRGCPHRCIFCNPFMGGRLRFRDLNLVIEELKVAKELYKIREFAICEPVFNIKHARVMEFCELLLKEKINLPWYCSSGLRADHITDEMIKMMKKAGCYIIKMGVETLVPEVFKNINKGETIEEITKAVEIVKNNGLPVEGSFIIGLPGDTYKHAIRNYELARKLGFERTDWSMLVPYPGTAAYDWVKKNGRIYHDYKDADQYAGQVNSQFKIKVAFDTEDFILKDRLKALKKISLKSKTNVWTYTAEASFPLKYLILFWNLLRHDFFNPKGNFKFIVNGIKNKMNKKRTLHGFSNGAIFVEGDSPFV